MHTGRFPGIAAAILCLLYTVAIARPQQPDDPNWKLEVSANHRFFQHGDGTLFFWLGDTGWLMFKKLDREETERYLENRRVKGFNVVQAMVMHTANDVNAYGSAALIDQDPGRPNLTPGNDLSKQGEYDFWDTSTGPSTRQRRKESTSGWYPRGAPSRAAAI
jgi:hypothetical protein